MLLDWTVSFTVIAFRCWCVLFVILILATINGARVNEQLK